MYFTEAVGYIIIKIGNATIFHQDNFFILHYSVYRNSFQEEDGLGYIVRALFVVYATENKKGKRK